MCWRPGPPPIRCASPGSKWSPRSRPARPSTSLKSRRGYGIRIELITAAGEVALDGSHLLVESGRSPRIEGLDLDAAGILYDRTGITVDRLLKTTNRRVYAIGDAISGPAEASRAEYE